MAASIEGHLMKGYLFNLIIYTDNKKRAEFFRQKVHAFIEKFPCRVIFIFVDPEISADYLKVTETFNKCDQLTVNTSHNRLLQTPYVIIRHLVPDLPVYLLWGDDPTVESEILTQLESLATRFIYDAECASDLKNFSTKLIEKIKGLPIEFMDLQWAASSGWRNVIYQCFSSKKRLEELASTKHLLIKYNHMQDVLQCRSALQAIYLIGWLAAQLNWTFSSIALEGDSQKVCFDYQGRTIECELIPQNRPTLEQGTVFEMEYASANGNKTLLSLAEKQSKVIVYRSTLENCELPFSFQVPDMRKGLAVVKEMFYSLPTVHYHNMLAVISTIPWKRF